VLVITNALTGCYSSLFSLLIFLFGLSNIFFSILYQFFLFLASCFLSGKAPGRSLPLFPSFEHWRNGFGTLPEAQHKQKSEDSLRFFS